MSEERMIEIETKLAYQEDLVETLNKTVYQQQHKIDQLEATCRALAQHMATMAQAINEGGGGQERPPHY